MILITGGAGYIGSHTVINLINHYKDVIIFDNLETGNISTIETLAKLGNIKFIKGDLNNPADIDYLFEQNEIDTVLHFAASSIVNESFENPLKYYRNNVCASLNLLDAMKKFDVKKIIYSSTCSTYGKPNYTPIDEFHPQNPTSPYGISKMIVEQLLKDYEKAYNIKSIILRYFNVVGCDRFGRIGELHKPETHLIPCIIASVLKNDSVYIYGNNYNTPDGTCIRDYVNVEDVADAHYLAYEYLNSADKSEIFNIGAGVGISVKDAIYKCEKVLNKKINVKIKEPQINCPEILYANTAKAKNILGWSCKHTFEESIQTAYEWIKKL